MNGFSQQNSTNAAGGFGNLPLDGLQVTDPQWKRTFGFALVHRFHPQHSFIDGITKI